MTGDADERDRTEEIRRLLGGPAYRTLFRAVRRRFEATGSRPRSVTLRDLDPSETRALADLYGWNELPRAPLRVDLDRLDRILLASPLQTGLQEVLELLHGPLTDRRESRRREQAIREERWNGAFRHPAVEGRPVLRAWLEEIRGMGLLVRAARASGRSESELLEQALQVLSQLPAEGILLPVLAAEATGDAHALDPGRPLAGIVLRGVMRLAGLEELPASSTGRRALWSEVGVLCDPLSSHVLVLGLVPESGTRLACVLGEAAGAGEPVRITLRELEIHPLAVPAGTRIHVCENPVVVAAAADRLAGCCSPLVCTDGVPSVAVWALLKMLRRSRAKIRFHCDFDWSGIRIGQLLAERVSAKPWRYTREHYERRLREGFDLPLLAGAPAAAPWDPDLSRAMRRAGTALLEEHVLGDLLEDLGTKR